LKKEEDGMLNKTETKEEKKKRKAVSKNEDDDDDDDDDDDEGDEFDDDDLNLDEDESDEDESSSSNKKRNASGESSNKRARTDTNNSNSSSSSSTPAPLPVIDESGLVLTYLSMLSTSNTGGVVVRDFVTALQSRFLLDKTQLSNILKTCCILSSLQATANVQIKPEIISKYQQHHHKQ
jgi:hypothetical protein